LVRCIASDGDGRMTPASTELSRQVAWLFLLAIPIACVTWTVTHEEIFREPRDYCVRQTQTRRQWLPRKFFYVFTCEYCFSHYVTLAFVVLTSYHLLLDDWRGLVVGFFALVGVTNVYLSLFGRVRVDIKTERL
jgi:hypothetical protein